VAQNVTVAGSLLVIRLPAVHLSQTVPYSLMSLPLAVHNFDTETVTEKRAYAKFKNNVVYKIMSSACRHIYKDRQLADMVQLHGKILNSPIWYSELSGFQIMQYNNITVLSICGKFLN
jgi:hypothetical protein